MIKPETIPFVLCGVLCLLPLAIGVGAFYFMTLISNRRFILDQSARIDKDKIKHVNFEMSYLTREERKHMGKEEKE